MTAVIEPTGEVRENEALGARVQHSLHRHPAIGPASVLVVSVIAFSIANPRFLNATNLSLTIQQVAVLATLAIGQTMIILTAGIDLSVGAAAILAQMVIAQTAANNHVPGVLAILLGIIVGAADRLPQRLPGDQDQAAALHRDAGHAEHLHRDRPAVLQRPVGLRQRDAEGPDLDR